MIQIQAWDQSYYTLTLEGLPTPYYSLYLLFSSIDGSIVEMKERLKEHIFHIASGATQFTYIKHEIEPKLDLTIDPDMFVLLEIEATEE